MNWITCPECEGEGYLERLRGDQFLGKERCSRCDGGGEIEDTSSLELYELYSEAEDILTSMEQVYDSDYDRDGVVEKLISKVFDALEDLGYELTQRCK